jgi:hypothetical protein
MNSYRHRVSLSIKLSMFFLYSLGYLCRSTDAELDEIIFKIFDLTDSKFISEEELMMMLINLPDMGFSSSNNIY